MQKLKYMITVSMIVAVLLSLAGFPTDVSAAPTHIGLGTAENFAVLAGTGITNTGATTITGDVGTFPTTSETGLTPCPAADCVTLTGTDQGGDGVTQGAKTNLTTAYNTAAGEGPTTPITGGTLGGGQTLTPGVYNSASSIGLTGSLTLNGGGDPNAVFVFQAGSTLVTASSSTVILTGGTQACNVYWQVGSSATLGTTSNFVGTILALDSITDNGYSTVDGRFLARNAAVTLNHTTITRPFCDLEVSKSFSPATITAGNVSTLTLTLHNINDTAATLTSSFTDNLPSGLLIAGTPNAATTCGGTGALTASGSSVTLPTGRIISGDSTCRLTVNVTAPLTGTFVNTVSSGALVTTSGSNTTAASATLRSNSPPTTAASVLPASGFAPQRITVLSAQPAEKAYAILGDLWLEIPQLDVQMPIVGVPQSADGTWDVSWLGTNAGWLQGSAFPTWAGNSVLTGHVYDANGKPGPFVHLNQLGWDDKIIVHYAGAQYVYAVRSVMEVMPNDTTAMLKHETPSWITLVTCSGYDQASNSYKYRVLVRAVLVDVE
jgi:LPXTG-site transpeptidase (sortase) family protein